MLDPASLMLGASPAPAMASLHGPFGHAVRIVLPAALVVLGMALGCTYGDLCNPAHPCRSGDVCVMGVCQHGGATSGASCPGGSCGSAGTSPASPCSGASCGGGGSPSSVGGDCTQNAQACSSTQVCAADNTGPATCREDCSGTGLCSSTQEMCVCSTTVRLRFCVPATPIPLNRCYLANLPAFDITDTYGVCTIGCATGDCACPGSMFGAQTICTWQGNSTVDDPLCIVGDLHHKPRSPDWPRCRTDADCVGTTARP